jgi:hypothetical protein
MSYVRMNGDALHELASQFLALAQRQSEEVPIMIGHRVVGHARLLTGHLLESRAHYDEALKLYDPVKHGVAAARVGGHDARMNVLCHRARALWLLGYPEAALADAGHAVSEAYKIEQAATLLHALSHAPVTYVHCGDYCSAVALLAELAKLADEKGAALWKAYGLMTQGAVKLSTAQPSDAVHLLTTGINAFRRTGATVFVPWYLTLLASAYQSLDHYDDAWRTIGESDGNRGQIERALV